jgi:hypothetical protein
MAHTLGWQGVFKMLAAVALLTGIAAAFFLVNQLRAATPSVVVGARVQGGGPSR